MRIERSMRTGIPAAEVYAMATSVAFQELTCERAGALSWHVSVADGGRDADGTDGEHGAVVRIRRRMPALGFPALLRRLVPAGVSAIETVSWGPAGSDGSRVATLSAAFPGTPATMHGEIRLRAEDAATSTLLVDVDFRAHVPLLGGRIESLAAGIILAVIDAEEACGHAWAAGLR